MMPLPTRYFVTYFSKLRRNCKQKLGITNTILLLSFFTGVFGATAAIIIKNLLYFSASYLANDFTASVLSKIFPRVQHNYLYLAFPLIGIILTIYYVKRFVKDDVRHGVSKVLGAISNNNGKLSQHNMYSSMIGSSITVGFGGSVGLEAPMVLTGSAIGSNLAQYFKMSPKNTVLLLACGCTAAFAAVFKAPIAALVFAIEMLMIDFTAATVLPLMVAAATGIVLSILFMGHNVMFTVPADAAFYVKNVPYYIILGVFTALISLYFIRTLRAIESWFSKMKRKYLKGILGGLFLGGLIFFFPMFYGEGYISINEILSSTTPELLFKNSPLFSLTNLPLLFLGLILAIILLKVIAMAITMASGGVGGTFAPSLFIGGFCGFFVAHLLNLFFGLHLPYINFVLAGMAGIMSGVMLTPLTAIFLTAELSIGYSLLIPLMITSSISYLIVSPIEKYSLYGKKLAEKGELKTHNKDFYAMRKVDWRNLIDNDVATIPIHSTLRDYTLLIANSTRNLFVVIREQKFAGLLVMDFHRDIIFDQNKYDSVCVIDLMIEPEEFIFETDSTRTVLDKFKRTGNHNLPIIKEDRTYVGFLSSVKVLTAYQDFIAEESNS
ncbi:MAG: chloride channel protein [Bacteroidales bacterium]|jgi:CIC family chloride channel protein|nr:chloride channel protein [Bacteroidales bacterium]